MEKIEINDIMNLLNNQIDKNLSGNIKKREPFFKPDEVPNSASSNELSSNELGLNKDMIQQMMQKVNGIQNKTTDQIIPTDHINIDKLSLFGYSMPYTTLYFTIVLVAIAVLIYLASGKKKHIAKEESDKSVD